MQRRAGRDGTQTTDTARCRDGKNKLCSLDGAEDSRRQDTLGCIKKEKDTPQNSEHESAYTSHYLLPRTN